MKNGFPVLVLEEVQDPEALRRARAQRARFDRNAAWLRRHASEVYVRHRGKCICVAGEDLFVGDTPAEARALARSEHPEDDGMFVQYIPCENVPRVYAV